MKMFLLKNSLVAIAVMAFLWYLQNPRASKAPSLESRASFWVFYTSNQDGSQSGLGWDGESWRCDGLRSITALTDEGHPIQLGCENGKLTVIADPSLANQSSDDDSITTKAQL